MVNEILRAAAIPAEEARFPDPPAETYAVYFDDVDAGGADLFNPVVKHDYTVELYEPTKDAAAEARLETELNTRGIPWTKQGRYWLDSVRRYQVIYEFSHIEKMKEE